MAMAASLKEFLLAALREDQRIDGRRPFDSRRLTIKFAREDGAAEVQLGQTHVMCVVSCQLVQPYFDRPNEGTLVVYTEFSPMADPTFEVGRPGESAVELGRVIDRGLRLESRAIDTESLCVLAGKAVWSLRIDICILDNGGNLVDAASIAALAALLSFRRPECSIGGAEGKDVVIHPPEIREPLPLIIHYLPIAVTFGFFGDGELVVMDPSYKEELLMRGRLTVILNIHGDICAIQKGGGVGVTSSDIMRCLRIASTKVADVTVSLKKAAEAHELERAQRKIKMHRNISRVEDVTVEKDVQMRDAMLENVVASNLGNLDDGDSSSNNSDDDSNSEEEKISDSFKSSRVVKREVKRTGRLGGHPGDSLFRAAVPQWEDDKKPSLGFSTRLSASSAFGELQWPIGGQDQDRQMLSALEVETSLVSQKMGRVGIQASREEGNTERDAPSAMKSRPLSLLDAVKRNNLKKKKADGPKA